MAVPAYATDLVDITTSFTTNWNLITEGGGGANSISAPETDDFIQGTESVSRNPFSSSIRGIAYNRAAITIAAGDAAFIWWKADVAQALDTQAGGGVRLVMGSGLTAYRQYFVAGSDTYQLGGWRCVPLDPTNAGDLDRGTPGTPNWSVFGVAYDVPAAGPSKGNPFKIDMIRHGRDVEVTQGEIANPATWDLLATHADATTRRWGIVQGTNTGAAVQGRVYWGTAAALCYSRDSNRTITLTDTQGFTPTDFTQLIFSNASTDLEWTNISVASLDTLNRGIVTVLNNAPVSLLGCSFSDINTTTDGGSNSVWDGSVWRRCNAVTAAGGSFVGCGFTAPTVAADASGLIWNIALDPDTYLEDAEFTKGTAAHHAIEFGLTSPLTMVLRGIDFSGFSLTNNVNDSTLNILRTTGTVTISLVGCTGNISYKTAGATVVLVQDPVTTTVTVRDVNTGNPVQDARVYMTAAAGGPLTVGTVIIQALSDVNGEASDTRTLASAQPVTGWVRRATSGTLYRQSAIAGTISNLTGLAITVQMIPDE